MRHFVMYLDESGTANLDRESEKYFILTGLIVEDRADQELQAYLKHIKRRHLGNDEANLHAFPMFEDKKSDAYLKNSQSKSFTSSLTEFIENAPFKILTYYVDKTVVRDCIKAPQGYSFKSHTAKNKQTGEYKRDAEFPYEIISRRLFFDFAAILKKEKAIGSIIAESRRHADHELLNTYLGVQNPDKFKSFPKIAREAENSKTFIHSICFAGKGSLKGGLELADIVSYCTNYQLRNMFPEQKQDNKGLKRMWEKIKKQMFKSAPQEITKKQIKLLAPDKIDEISKRVAPRLKENSDLLGTNLSKPRESYPRGKNAQHTIPEGNSTT